MGNPTRVLVVDDSSLVRQILTQGLAKDPDIEVVGHAANPYLARDAIVKLKPDVLTLDVEMPEMDGLEFLQKLMPQYPMPVVMVSSLTQQGHQITLSALDAGAVDFVAKPCTNVARGLDAMMGELVQKVKMAATVDRQVLAAKAKRAPRKIVQVTGALAQSTDKVVAIGASTGGVEAITEVILGMPAASPGVVIVQHMPAGFTKSFADQLNNAAAMQVKEAEDGDRVIPGHVLIAPGSFQLTVIRSGGVYKVQVKPGEKRCGHCPSVETMMESVAKCAGANAVGVILTGMGADGAGGLKAMRDAGAKTLAQDEKTSLVFGMPKQAIAKGGAEKVKPLQEIAKGILEAAR